MSDNNTENLRFATALLYQSGELEYLLKSNIAGYEARIVLLPGMGVDETQGIIAPDDKLMFTNSTNKINTVVEYDLSLNVQLYTLVTQKPSGSAAPVIYGDFAGLSGDTEITYLPQPSRFGFMPIKNGRLLLFYYLGRNGVHYEKFPAVGVLDFPNRRGDKYSPGKLETGSFEIKGVVSNTLSFLYNDMSASDKMLNYDERGMIYLSANGRSFLVKTRIK